MERFQPGQDVRRFLQMFHGYALTGLTGEQVFVFNYGLGANGKSTFMEAIARLMGSYAKMLPSEALTGDIQKRGDQATPEFARLPGARLVRCAELPRGQGFRENTIKLLTGGEPMLVRHLHKGFFDMRPTFKAIGSGNDKPSVGGVDEGIWRRMRLVPWGVTIPVAERRPMAKVLEEFEAESAGILNWLLDGLTDYLENGLIVPPEVQSATDSYRSDMDPVGEYVAACVVAEEESTVAARAMYEAYVAWCHANSVKPYSERNFAGIMVQKGYRKSHGRIRLYHGVRLEGVPEDPERAGPA
jgi:putative DNA primase/helicase